jgi:anaerobic selenocysteine-containing dehydrogenase
MATMRFNPIPFANYSQAVVQPEDETKHEWEIFSMMGEKAGFPIFTGHPADLFKMMLKDNDQIKYKELVSSEKGIFYTDDKKLKYNQLLPDCIAFPDQLIPLVPQDYEEELKKLEQYDFSQNPDYPYSLISGRQIETINSWIHERLDINHCYINPKDAVKLGIVDGEPVKVSTKIGSIEIEAKITDDLMENVIWIPHGWGRTITDVPDEAVEKNGVNVNLITDDDWTKLETFAGMVMLDGIPVRIEKIQYR